MSNKPIFRDFDLPTIHLEGLNHWVPPKSRYDYEISRRQTLPRGVLLAEYQQRGLAVASTILRHVSEPEDVSFTGNVLAAATMNSSWYDLARRAQVMRRRLKLPILAEEDRDYVPTSESLLAGAIGELSNAASFADMHIAALKQRTPEIQSKQRSLGRVMGNSALTLACLGMNQNALAHLTDLPDDLIQQAVRRRGLMALHQGHILGEEIGAPPSLAQLADPNSDLAVFWRRQAPTGAFEAFELATELHRAA